MHAFLKAHSGDLAALVLWLLATASGWRAATPNATRLGASYRATLCCTDLPAIVLYEPPGHRPLVGNMVNRHSSHCSRDTSRLLNGC